MRLLLLLWCGILPGGVRLRAVLGGMLCLLGALHPGPAQACRATVLEPGRGPVDLWAHLCMRSDPTLARTVQEMLAKYSKDLGITPRKISDQEIVERLVFALVNEGARILEEGIASKASDIDMVYLTGYGFPLWRGGPMLYADTVGLFNVVQSMKRFARNPHDDAKFWQPAPLLRKLADEGKTFN